MSKHKARVVMIAMAINQPRVQRRILALDKAGFDLVVYAFDRKIYGNNAWISGCRAEIRLLGSMTGGGSVRNVLSLLCGLIRVVYAEASKAKMFLYFFGFSPVLINMFLGKAHRIYEVGDLRFTSRDAGLLKRAQLKLENLFLKEVDAVVLTSAEFLRELDVRVPGLRSKAIIIENGIPAELIGDWQRLFRRPRVADRRIRVGFIGYVRYTSILSEFVKAVGQRPTEYELHIYGNGYNVQALIGLCDQFENVVFHGRFRNPEDLRQLYEHIDLGLAVYDNSDRNVQLALPNKLYESVYFCVPLVVSVGTSLWDRVNRWGVGYGVNPNAEGFAERFLDSLSDSGIKKRQDACAHVSSELLVAQIGRLTKYMIKEATKYEANLPKT